MQRLVLLENNEFQWIDYNSSIIFNIDEQSNKITSIESQANKLTTTKDFPKIFRTKPTQGTDINPQNTFWLIIVDNELYRSDYNSFAKGVVKAGKVDTKSVYVSIANILTELFPTCEKCQQAELVKFEVNDQEAAHENNETIIQSSPNSITALLPENDQSENSNDDGYRPADKPYFDRLIGSDTEEQEQEQIQLALAIKLSLEDQQNRQVSTDKYSLKSVIDNYLHLTLTNKSINASIMIGVATSLAVFLFICAISNPVALVTATIAGVTSGIATGTACFFGFKRFKLPEYDAANHQSNLNHCVL